MPVYWIPCRTTESNYGTILILLLSVKHVACPAGTYLSPSNGSCSDCPANSVSEEEGLAQCTCIEGYQRAKQGEEDLPCTCSKHLAAVGYLSILCFILQSAM